MDVSLLVLAGSCLVLWRDGAVHDAFPRDGAVRSFFPRSGGWAMGDVGLSGSIAAGVGRLYAGLRTRREDSYALLPAVHDGGGSLLPRGYGAAAVALCQPDARAGGVCQCSGVPFVCPDTKSRGQCGLPCLLVDRAAGLLGQPVPPLPFLTQFPSLNAQCLTLNS